ncbi:MAG TPA: PIN domain-containing protein [Vicinamibacteria bacterium]|nr:PIN domain-containing protein [Vicinamibacteria bacterium]
MPRYVCDTNCLIATVSPWHEHHERTRSELERRADAGEELRLAAHSIVEAFAVVTRLPSRHRLKPSDALSLLESNWGQTTLVYLTGREVWNALRRARTSGVVGGRTYDLLLAMAALKANASTILTWNVRHFELFKDDIDVITPK